MLKSIAAATSQLGLGINEVPVLMVTPRRTFAYNKLMEWSELITCDMYLDMK